MQVVFEVVGMIIVVVTFLVGINYLIKHTKFKW